MKKTLVFAAFLTASLLAHAESMTMHLSADLATTGTMLPAGDYTISPVSGNSSVLLVKGSGLHAFVFGRVIASSLLNPKPSVEFSKDKSFAPSPAGKAFALTSPKK